MSELWYDPEGCLCGALSQGVECSWTVLQVSQFPPVQTLVQPCIQSLLGDYGADQMQEHCPVQCTASISPSNDDAAAPKASSAVLLAPLVAVAAAAAAAGAW